MKPQICPKCKKPMKNLGNVSGVFLTSNPVQWDDVYVCDDCTTKRTVRTSPAPYDPTGGRNLEKYTDVSKEDSSDDVAVDSLNANVLP